MKRAVVFRPEAEAEFGEAQDWYEARSRGLGGEFVAYVAAAVEQLRDEPDHLQRVDGEVRRALVRRFPYAVLYLADSESVVVLAVFHTSRDPNGWRARIR